MKPKSKGEILNLISKMRVNIDDFEGHKPLQTRYRNYIRILQWSVGLRSRWYPEGEGLMQKEDTKALERESELRKKLRMKSK